MGASLPVAHSWNERLKRYERLRGALGSDPDEPDKALERLCRTMNEIIIHTPAPDGWALFEKMKMAFELSQGVPFEDGYMRSLLSDAERLAGEGSCVA